MLYFGDCRLNTPNMLDQRIQIIQGDITRLDVAAIVNAANPGLLGGGGVDGAIHRAAGPELRAFNKTLGGCKTGEAKISPGFRLPAEFVISTVGPVWKGGNSNEAGLLGQCYYNSLKLASAHNITSIAFPAISTGVYGFPFRQACEIALSSSNQFLGQNDSIQKVLMVSFSEADFNTYLGIYTQVNSR